MPSRFIAGAVCPACGAIDRIVVDGDLDNRVRRCVECDFRETLSAHSSVVQPPQSNVGDATLADAVHSVRLVGEPGGVRGTD
jgi:uncharacterized metal-binding protein (TIGR02443 family)